MLGKTLFEIFEMATCNKLTKTKTKSDENIVMSDIKLFFL